MQKICPVTKYLLRSWVPGPDITIRKFFRRAEEMEVKMDLVYHRGCHESRAMCTHQRRMWTANYHRPSVWVCWGCCNKEPQTRWFKQGYKYRIKVMMRLVSPEGCEKEFVLSFSPSFHWLAGNLWYSLTCRSLSSFYLMFSICMSVYLSIFPPFYKSYWSKAHPMTSF